jgi:hypothetical protein
LLVLEAILWATSKIENEDSEGTSTEERSNLHENEPVANIVLTERKASAAVDEVLRLTAAVQNVGIRRAGQLEREVERRVAKFGNRFSFVHYGCDAEYV